MFYDCKQVLDTENSYSFSNSVFFSIQGRFFGGEGGQLSPNDLEIFF